MSTRFPGWKLDAPLAGHRPESDSNLSLAPQDKAPRSEKRRCQSVVEANGLLEVVI